MNITDLSQLGIVTRLHNYLLDNNLYDKLPKVFLDIGANDGQHCSNSYTYGLLGWQIIYVEPIFEYEELIKTNVPFKNWTFICKAVADVDGETDLFSNPWDDGIEIGQGRSGDCLADIGGNRVRNVEVISFPTLIKLANLKECGLASIDAEGVEFMILRSMMTTTFRPWLIIVETDKIPNGEVNEIVSEYKLIIKDKINSVYIRNDLCPKE